MRDLIGYIFIFFAILLMRYFATAGVFYAYYSKFKNTKTTKILSRRPAKKSK